ncbi:hypothetical protein DY000_02040214 [Brassica cretica]|uniref:Uncharacterized protein n=1 Tax=Brassica cretica TaxID=69181 RepID=A0ABQ7BDN7_BRACR|nr:hypothetical protein DY000_02040214 [Brassica cretica]
MTTNADKDPQTHDGTPVDANDDKTLAGNVSTVTTDAAILDQMKEMFASAQKKTDEQGKLVASLAKQVETLTAKAGSIAPRGTTRARSGRRLDFETPGNRAAHADKASSGQNPDGTLQPGAQPTAENLPPLTGSNEGEEIERIDLDISDHVASRVAGELGRDTGQLAQRARPRPESARSASTAMLPVESPASSAVTRASSPGEHDRVVGRLSGELDRAADRLARQVRPILHGPFRSRTHPITMRLRPRFP